MGIGGWAFASRNLDVGKKIGPQYMPTRYFPSYTGMDDLDAHVSDVSVPVDYVRVPTLIISRIPLPLVFWCD